MKLQYLVLFLCAIALISLVLIPVLLGLFYFQRIGALWVWINFGIFILSFIGVWMFTKES